MDEREISTQAKLFILYILGNIDDAVGFTTLNDMVVQDGFICYFDFAAAFSDMLEKGQVEPLPRTGGEEPRYTITAQGRSVLETYQQEMPSDVKERSIRHAMRVLAFQRDGVRQSAQITEEANGCTLHCSISDSQKTMLDVSVFLSERSYAEQLQKNFMERADVVYRGVLSLLSGDVNYIFDE